MDRLANLLVEKEIVSGREVLEIVGMDPTAWCFNLQKMKFSGVKIKPAREKMIWKRLRAGFSNRRLITGINYRRNV
jgi:hypothetical protein